MHEIKIRKNDNVVDMDQENVKARLVSEAAGHVHLSVIEERVKELEAALMPFAAIGKVAISSTEETSTVHNADCVRAYKTLYKQK